MALFMHQNLVGNQDQEIGKCEGDKIGNICPICGSELTNGIMCDYRFENGNPILESVAYTWYCQNPINDNCFDIYTIRK